MEKGKIIWIKYEGLYYCSEIKCILPPKGIRKFWLVTLFPIIGNCTDIGMDKEDDDLNNCVSITVFLDNDFWGTEGIASYNFEKIK